MNIINGDKCSAANSNKLLESQTHIWNHMYGFINSMCLKCAVELNIPDTVHAHARPMTLSSLVQALHINPTKATHLKRLMRILTHSGFFIITTETQEERYLLAPVSRLLLKDEPASLRPLILGGLEPVMIGQYFNLSHFFNNSDGSMFHTAYNNDLWEYFGNDERLSASFNDIMAKDSALIGAVVVQECGKVFDGLKSVVDVGGGTGTLARTIAGDFPEIEWTVLDLPQVVNQLESEKNLHFVGGDMFESIPNADAVLLKWILHDWSDEQCVRILKNCKKAIPTKKKGGKVVIIEMVIDNHNIDKKSTESQLFYDMVMMFLVKGRERDENDWNKIFTDAGVNEYKITDIGSRSVIELYFSDV